MVLFEINKEITDGMVVVVTSITSEVFDALTTMYLHDPHTICIPQFKIPQVVL
jgi:hypothetical protein